MPRPRHNLVWSCVGSTNLDWRSFLHNDELDATILGRELAFDLILALTTAKTGSAQSGPQEFRTM